MNNLSCFAYPRIINPIARIIPGAETNPNSTAPNDANTSAGLLSFSIPPATQANRAINPPVSTTLTKAG
ncbi:hypothetical protein THIOM_001616 [Candidatus Thiomargarita nelsonii]|uniref:Uncharacterized protein n=1 Tax=Candidatus Thiomargarita nelsonii TaxID=1003181 RepID=A0A176S3S2_9GAMM|nr:hypothetical protein THIOM_001616 [Candidatus Thiomargarita nelsonii]